MRIPPPHLHDQAHLIWPASLAHFHCLRFPLCLPPLQPLRGPEGADSGTDTVLGPRVHRDSNNTTYQRKLVYAMS